MEKVILPLAGGPKSTSRLGFGMASLMREPSRRKRLYVLEAAYGAGFRHFDTAPLYGLGIAERDLGVFLKRTDGDCTIATKFGLEPTTLARGLAKLQPPLRAALRASKSLTRVARNSIQVAKPVPGGVSQLQLEGSVVRSVRRLDVGAIDLLLMHDVPWSAESSDFWQGLVRPTLGGVGAVGIAGSTEVLSSFPSDLLDQIGIVQTSCRGVGAPRVNSSRLVIQYGALVQLHAFQARLRDSPLLQTELQDIAQLPLRTKGQIAGFLALMALASTPGSILLVGTTNARHAESLWAMCRDGLVAVDNTYTALSTRLGRS